MMLSATKSHILSILRKRYLHISSDFNDDESLGKKGAATVKVYFDSSFLPAFMYCYWKTLSILSAVENQRRVSLVLC